MGTLSSAFVLFVGDVHSLLQPFRRQPAAGSYVKFGTTFNSQMVHPKRTENNFNLRLERPNAVGITTPRRWESEDTSIETEPPKLSSTQQISTPLVSRLMDGPCPLPPRHKAPSYRFVCSEDSRSAIENTVVGCSQLQSTASHAAPNTRSDVSVTLPTGLMLAWAYATAVRCFWVFRVLGGPVE